MYTEMSSASTAGDPYFFVRKHREEIETRGQPIAEFGHRINSTTHPVTDGIFANWHWDGMRLVVENDRYGLYPLFWFSTSEGVCISPSLISLIEQGAPTELDVGALAVFFRLGCFIGEDTPFSAIKVMPPNAVFEWENGELKCHGRYPPVPKAVSISRDEAIDTYIRLFASAMEKRRPATDSFAVPISGGRDSRHILLELYRTGFKPAICVSAKNNPPDPNQDPEIAASLCARLRLEHAIIDQQLSLLSAQTRKNWQTHFCTSQHGWYLAVADYLNGRFDSVYDGIAGDVLSAGLFLNPELDNAFRSQNVNAITAQLLTLSVSMESILKELLRGKLKESLNQETASRRLAREVERHLNAPSPATSFYFWNRTRRDIALAPYSLLTDIPNVYAPYLDHNLFDFLATLPASMLMDHSFHNDTIARAYPAFADHPYADHKAAAPTDDTDVRARFVAEAARKFLLHRPSTLMNNMVPRAKMLVGVLSRGRIIPWISPLVIYLEQIESIIDRRHRARY